MHLKKRSGDCHELLVKEFGILFSFALPVAVANYETEQVIVSSDRVSVTTAGHVGRFKKDLEGFQIAKSTLAKLRTCIDSMFACAAGAATVMDCALLDKEGDDASDKA